MRFRKKPVEVEAVQWDEPDGAYGLIDWADTAIDYDPHTSGPSNPLDGKDWGRLAVTTLEGEHVATPGDWLIRGVKGEFYFCKPDVFAATYEPVDGGERS
ncbi:hypothetical protein M3G91_23520 [Micromonospora chalcea]|uniref:hypothetical protein n=1 Tax=Micromonospora chalcea TaxID=1874 RepID=UPI0021A63F28|nr:hypothetical protein [Micromonospora chalcea]MCT2280589.1 hypothetical protein [Micromonospora chalcea]